METATKTPRRGAPRGTTVPHLRAQRKLAKLTIEGLAHEAGLTMHTVWRAEMGERISAASIQALSDVLHIPADALTGMERAS